MYLRVKVEQNWSTQGSSESLWLGLGVGWMPVAGQRRRGRLGKSWPKQGSKMDKSRCSLHSLFELTELTACVSDTELDTRDWFR